MYADQCVMNSVFDGEYCPLEMKWNVSWHLPYYSESPEKELSAEKYAEYFEARKNPWIVHYSGAIKPWKDTEVELADLWWKYARGTDHYEGLLLLTIRKMVQDISVLSSCRIKYHWYELLSNITFGNKRSHYNQLRRVYKERIKILKDLLSRPI